MSNNNQQAFEEQEEDYDSVDIEYGIRRRRDATSHQYRDSSSLSPSQIMEQEFYWAVAIDILQRCILIAQCISRLLAGYAHFHRLLRHYQSHAAERMQDTIRSIRSTVQSIKNATSKLYFYLQHMMCYGELAFLYAEDMSIFIRRRHRFPPKCFRRIQDLSRHDCYAWYGLSPRDLRRLYKSWRVPRHFRSRSRHVFGGEECFLITLYYMIKGTPIHSVVIPGIIL